VIRSLAEPPPTPPEQPPAQPPVQPPAQPQEKPLAPDQCPRCRSESTTILRKVPIAYGHEVTRKCDKCGNTWTYKSKFGAGAWP
jgi:hypothetical protein